MKDFSKPRTFIISAYQHFEGVDVDQQAHVELGEDLASRLGSGFQECTGSYEGQAECGYIVVGAHHQSAVEDLCDVYGQETYLCIAEHDRIAYLVDCATDYHTHLGRFRAAGEVQPDCESWTLLDGTYYITDGSPGVNLPSGF